MQRQILPRALRTGECFNLSVKNVRVGFFCCKFRVGSISYGVERNCLTFVMVCCTVV